VETCASNGRSGVRAPALAAARVAYVENGGRGHNILRYFASQPIDKHQM
jgi:hypothetical protein